MNAIVPGFGEVVTGMRREREVDVAERLVAPDAVDEALVVPDPRAERGRLDRVRREVELDRHGELGAGRRVRRPASRTASRAVSRRSRRLSSSGRCSPLK